MVIIQLSSDNRTPPPAKQFDAQLIRINITDKLLFFVIMYLNRKLGNGRTY